jgi:hypothetical protein
MTSASLTASPGMQQAALLSPPESGGNDTGKTKIADSDIEEESAEGAPDFISDQELITNSEIEEAPSTSSQTQYSAESSGRSDSIQKNRRYLLVFFFNCGDISWLYYYEGMPYKEICSWSHSRENL